MKAVLLFILFSSAASDVVINIVSTNADDQAVSNFMVSFQNLL